MLFYTLCLVVMVSASCGISDWIEFEDSLFQDEVSDDCLSDYDHCYKSDQNIQNLFKASYAPDIMHVQGNEQKAMICDNFIVEIIKSTVQGQYDVEADRGLVSFLQDVQKNLDDDVIDTRVYVYIAKRMYSKLLGHTTDKVFELSQDDFFVRYKAEKLESLLNRAMSADSFLRSEGVLVLKKMLEKVQETLSYRTRQMYKNGKRPMYRYSYYNDKQPETRLKVVDMWLECLKRTLLILIDNWKPEELIIKEQGYKMAKVGVFLEAGPESGKVIWVRLLGKAELFDRNNRVIGNKNGKKNAASKDAKNKTNETESGCLRPITQSNNAPKIDRPVVLGLADSPKECFNSGMEQNDTSRTQLADNKGTVLKKKSLKWSDRLITGSNQSGSSTDSAYHSTNIVRTDGNHSAENLGPASLSGEDAITHVSVGTSTDDIRMSSVTDQPVVHGTTSNGANDSFLAHTNVGSDGIPGTLGRPETPDADTTNGASTLVDDLPDRPASSL